MGEVGAEERCIGKTPTVGFAIFESPAICIHLAEAHPYSNLIPQVGDKNRTLFFQWVRSFKKKIEKKIQKNVQWLERIF